MKNGAWPVLVGLAVMGACEILPLNGFSRTVRGPVGERVDPPRQIVTAVHSVLVRLRDGLMRVSLRRGDVQLAPIPAAERQLEKPAGIRLAVIELRLRVILRV